MRVVFRDVQPGDTVAFNGEWLTVSAEVAGIKEDEPVSLIYNTADRQTVDQVVPLPAQRRVPPPVPLSTR